MKLTTRRCQCPGCKEYFNSLSAFEQHRKGHYKTGRYCAKPDSVGMVKNEAGFWTTGINPVFAEQ